jgi:hypothetical protein
MEIRDLKPHGGNYEDSCLLGCDTCTVVFTSD